VLSMGASHPGATGRTRKPRNSLRPETPATRRAPDIPS
jgi:hypothetical protein